MLISDLKNGIVQKKLNNFYIFTGEEEGIMGIYTKQIAKCLGLTIKWADSIEEISKLVNLKSLVGVKYLYLVRQDNAITKEEKLWDFLKSKIVGHHVILIQPTIDSRSKFSKFFQEEIINFTKLSRELLTGYIKKKCPKLSESCCNNLIEWCAFSYSRVMNELDKILTLEKVTGNCPDFCMSQLDAEGGIYKEREFDVFKYVDHIMSRNIFACYKDLQYVKSQKCEILLVSLLMNNFKALLLLKLDGGGAGVCDRTGLTGWQIKNAINCKENYSTKECENILLFLQKTEVKIKTGSIQPEYILDYILARIL